MHREIYDHKRSQINNCDRWDMCVRACVRARRPYFETVRTIERRAIAKLKQPQHAALILPYLPPDAADRLKEEMGKTGSPAPRTVGRPKKATKEEEGKEEGKEDDSVEHFTKALAAAIEAVDERAGGGRVLGGRARLLGTVPGRGAAGAKGSGARQRRRGPRQTRRRTPQPQPQPQGHGGGGEGEGASSEGSEKPAAAAATATDAATAAAAAAAAEKQPTTINVT